MKKWMAAAALAAMTIVPLRADVMLVQTMTIEGAAAAMMGNGKMPRMTMRIKGQKSRADIEVGGQTITAIADLAAKQVILLNSASKTATVTTAEALGAGAPVPKIDVSFKPTGNKQVIEGQQCEEHAIRIQLSMAEATGSQLPPEAVAMMKDVQMIMDGSIWVAPAAPGSAEYAAFNKAAMQSNLFAAVIGMAGGGKSAAGLDKLMEAAATATGLPYRTDINMRFEGSGPMVDAMKEMGPIRMIQQTVSVSTDPIADAMFEVPADYKTTKK
jgi:hypothetical protein